MRRPLAFALAILFSATVFAGPAAARLIGDAGVPFSALRTVTLSGKTYVGKVYAAPGMQRHEQAIDGLHPVAILRADRRMAYLILPELAIYTELPFPDAIAQYGGVEKLGRPIGGGTVAGRKAAEYRIERTGADGSTLDGRLWLGHDGIVLRAAGRYAEPGQRPTEGTVELSDIRIGPQDSALFEVPPGLTLLPARTLEGLMSLRLAKPRP